MRTTIRLAKWENGSGVLPKSVAHEARPEEVGSVDVSVDNGTFACANPTMKCTAVSAMTKYTARLLGCPVASVVTGSEA